MILLNLWHVLVYHLTSFTLSFNLFYWQVCTPLLTVITGIHENSFTGLNFRLPVRTISLIFHSTWRIPLVSSSTISPVSTMATTRAEQAIMLVETQKLLLCINNVSIDGTNIFENSLYNERLASSRGSPNSVVVFHNIPYHCLSS